MKTIRSVGTRISGKTHQSQMDFVIWTKKSMLNTVGNLDWIHEMVNVSIDPRIGVFMECLQKTFSL